jgi:glutaredoxin
MGSKTIAEQCLLALAALLCAASASAQMYKWKDAKGVTHFSDTPPASVRDKAEVKNYGPAASGPALPYELAQASRANPVTLYTAAGCAPCEQGRALLQKRGIPYAEKSVSTADDQQKLKDAGSDGQLPLLVVGSSKLVGFNPGAWNESLDAASYPAQAMLPPGYKFAAAEPAASPAQRKPSAQALAQAAQAERAAKAAAEAAEKAKFAPKPPAINGTPDFQF